jgi:4a-hydroxytetrahydrobiopterin dehydratase
MWQELKNRLQASFKFQDFKAAMAFMTEVALHAEKLDHHPTWTNTYNTVDIQLATHEAGNIVTDKDRQLAEVIEKVYEKYRVE